MNADPASNEADDDAQGGERWVIVVRDAGGFEAPVHRRVARLLKSMLRSYGLRCTEIGPTTLPEELARSRDECLALAEEVDRLRAKLATRPRKRREKVT